VGTLRSLPVEEKGLDLFTTSWGSYTKREADKMVTDSDRFCRSGIGGTAGDRWGKWKWRWLEGSPGMSCCRRVGGWWRAPY
jgi:hypothetical protein